MLCRQRRLEAVQRRLCWRFKGPSGCRERTWCSSRTCSRPSLHLSFASQSEQQICFCEKYFSSPTFMLPPFLAAAPAPREGGNDSLFPGFFGIGCVAIIIVSQGFKILFVRSKNSWCLVFWGFVAWKMFVFTKKKTIYVKRSLEGLPHAKAGITPKWPSNVQSNMSVVKIECLKGIYSGQAPHFSCPPNRGQIEVSILIAGHILWLI